MNLTIFKGFEQFDDNYPVDAVKYAMENREEAIPELLEILEYTLSNVEKLSKDKNYRIHFPAIYLLAYFREARAYDPIIRIAYLPDEQQFDLLGDIITDDLGKIFASVCDGNIEPIKMIIENGSLDEFVKDQALDSLLILLQNDIISREELVFYMKELLDGKLEADFSLMWSSLPRVCSLMHPKGLEDGMRKAVSDGKIPKIFSDLSFMEHQLNRSVKEVLEELKKDEGYSFITESDVYSLEGWVGLDTAFDFDDEYLSNFDDDEIPINTPFIRENFIGRNDSCPCGSGKKYKKCCGK